MKRPLKEITLPLTGIKVRIAEWLTFGEYTELQGIFLKAAKSTVQADGTTAPTFEGDAIIRYNSKKLSLFVKSAADTDGKDILVDKDFVNNLPQPDGQFIESEVDAILATVKKKPN
jgi:hypothetical protein